MHLNAELNFTHLNVRREKNGDNRGPIACDVKLTGKLPVEQLKGLFATELGFATVLGALYADSGELVCGEIAELYLAREATGITAELCSPLSGALVLSFSDGAALNKLSLIPYPGRLVELGARLQIRPAKGQLDDLGDLLEQTVRVTIQAKQTSLDLESGSGTVIDGESRRVDEPPADAPPASGKGRQRGTRQAPKGQAAIAGPAPENAAQEPSDQPPPPAGSNGSAEDTPWNP